MKGRGPKLEVVDYSDPVDSLLKANAARLKETGNPYYAWMAIEICLTDKKDFPGWVTAYLAECAERMKSDKAKKVRDLREVLPWVFGFPPKKSGPGKLLHPGAGSHSLLFPLRFAIRIAQGEKPREAMRNACNEIFDEETAGVDDKTLERWLRKYFGLKAWPQNAAEWKTITKPLLDLVTWKGQIPRSALKDLEDFADKVSRNPVVTS